MKAVVVMVLIGATCACALSEDYVSPAEKCAQEQVRGASKIDASMRQLVASQCARQIQNWAMKGLEKLQGHPVDLGDVRSRQEYADRQQAILRLLVPLEDEPPWLSSDSAPGS